MNRALEEQLKLRLHKKLKSTLDKTIDNPVLKAYLTWQILSDQIKTILGDQVFNQCFKKVQPLVLKNNILLLQTETNFAAQWINTHYQELVDALVLTQDRKYTCFFIFPKKKEVSQSKSA